MPGAPAQGDDFLYPGVGLGQSAQGGFIRCGGFIAAVGKQPFPAMRSPDFRGVHEAGERHEIVGPATADEDNAGTAVLHDGIQQRADAGVGEGLIRVGTKRREGAVVVQQQGAVLRLAQLAEKPVQIDAGFEYFHRSPARVIQLLEIVLHAAADFIRMLHTGLYQI